MKRKTMLTAAALAGVLLLGGCRSGNQRNQIRLLASNSDSVRVITDKVRFCESTYPLNDSVLLIANFGTESLEPLNRRGRGYILAYSNGETEMFIPADGHLSAPKGMYVKGDKLFVGDVGQVAVYDLSDRQAAPKIISFPKGNDYVNDLAGQGDNLYVSVTDAGKIYRIDIADSADPDTVVPRPWCEIAGPNGLAIAGDSMYVASFPAEGNVSPLNVIYLVPDLKRPVPQKFIETAGQYDGIALSPDGSTLYVTNWEPAGIYAIDTRTKDVRKVDLGREVKGAADLSLHKGVLSIPDLPSSEVLQYVLYP